MIILCLYSFFIMIILSRHLKKDIGKRLWTLALTFCIHYRNHGSPLMNSLDKMYSISMSSCHISVLYFSNTVAVFTNQSIMAKKSEI